MPAQIFLLGGGDTSARPITQQFVTTPGYRWRLVRATDIGQLYPRTAYTFVRKETAIVVSDRRMCTTRRKAAADGG
jgi:hypothetical protein